MKSNLLLKLTVLSTIAVSSTLAQGSSILESWELRGPDYQSQDAKTKLTTIWTQVTADTSTRDWFVYSNDLLFKEDQHPTMMWEGDTVPYDKFWGKRDKVIHTQGVVATFKWVPAKTMKTQYTGMFASGCDNGVLRFSVGGEYDPTQPPDGNFGPNMGVKFLRDGAASANFVAAPNHQNDYNFFSSDFTQLIDVPGGDILALFKTATDYPQRMGLLEVARTDQQGNPASAPVFPYKLTFTATDDVKKMFPTKYTAPFTEQLATLKSGTAVFNVFALAEPTDTTPE